MYGIMFVILEEYIVNELGLKTWRNIKAKANCNVEDKGFLSRSYYDDSHFLNLLEATTLELNITLSSLLEIFGQIFTTYIYGNGYDVMLRNLGTTLRQWLSNLNAMHLHLAKSFPGDEFRPGKFWCETEESSCGAILLHYFSHRGPLLCPLVVGIIKEVSMLQFQLAIVMTQLETQGINGSEHSTWKITTKDPTKCWKLSFLTSPGDSPEKIQQNIHVDMDKLEVPMQCPFRAMQLKTSMNTAFSKATANNLDGKPSGLTLLQLRTVFPFHILVDKEFKIHQTGTNMTSILTNDDFDINDLLGKHVSNFLEITSPVIMMDWSWKNFKKLSDQKFVVRLKEEKYEVLTKDFTMAFSGSMIELELGFVLFVLSPEAKNVTELSNMGLMLADLPLHGHQRDSILLGEYIAQEVNKAYELEQLSKKFEHEKNLSNTILYNMLPRNIADDLRQGRPVQARLYENVTIFFSDIEGFTSICDKVDPWATIDMLNQLYCVMDYLASHFKLYKVETVGDSYMCCSGLPIEDTYHAENIANFAIAVTECVKNIKSPADGTPIKLRIGIHTGHCTAGVIGSLAPRFCLFGDMVNLTARHEQSSIAGRIHCSSALFHRLSKQSPTQFTLKFRGDVQMKGKGIVQTYWLEQGTVHNIAVNESSLAILSSKVSELLESKEWKVSRYFIKTEPEVQPALSNDSVAVDVQFIGEGSNAEPYCLNDIDKNDDTATTDGKSIKGVCEHTVDQIIEAIDTALFHRLESMSSGETVSECYVLQKSCDLLIRLFRLSFGLYISSNLDRLEKALCSFIKRIARFNPCSIWLAFAVATQANDLFSLFKVSTFLDASPLNQFILVFAAIIQNSSVTLGETLVTVDDQNSVKFLAKCLNILRNEFNDLYEEITWQQPSFVQTIYELLDTSREHLKNSIDRSNHMKLCFRDTIQKLNERNLRSPRHLHYRSLAVMSLILGLTNDFVRERIVFW